MDDKIFGVWRTREILVTPKIPLLVLPPDLVEKTAHVDVNVLILGTNSGKFRHANYLSLHQKTSVLSVIPKKITKCYRSIEISEISSVITDGISRTGTLSSTGYRFRGSEKNSGEFLFFSRTFVQALELAPARDIAPKKRVRAVLEISVQETHNTGEKFLSKYGSVGSLGSRGSSGGGRRVVDTNEGGAGDDSEFKVKFSDACVVITGMYLCFETSI
jgi:hypothetical protein